jgi:hypothetical protein
VPYLSTRELYDMYLWLMQKDTLSENEIDDLVELIFKLPPLTLALPRKKP